jgi:hypothetical protein
MEDWLEEGLLVPARKNQRGRIVEEGSSSAQGGGAQPNYAPPFGGIPTPPNYYGGPIMQASRSSIPTTDEGLRRRRGFSFLFFYLFL